MQARRYALFALAASLLAMSVATSVSAQTPDRDGDGYSDDEDGCPNEPANEQSPWPNGCPGHVDVAETPPASGPSCSAKMPCIVLKRKGLSKKRSGGYIDDNATVKVTIARDARGVPARVVGVQLRNVDTFCVEYGDSVYDSTFTSGPEVSANLDPLALTKKRVQHANYSSTAFLFDPYEPVRSISGQQYELGFYMEKDAGEAQLSVSFADEWNADHCRINIYGNNDPLTRTKTAAEKKAVAKCKKMPTDTKKQRRKRAKCLENARY